MPTISCTVCVPMDQIFIIFQEELAVLLRDWWPQHQILFHIKKSSFAQVYLSLSIIVSKFSLGSLLLLCLYIFFFFFTKG